MCIINDITEIHFHQRTTLTPEQFVAGLTDFRPGRSELFSNSADEYLKVHYHSRSEADVTEGSGGIWEHLQYDWSDPNRVVLDRHRCGRRTPRQELQGTAAWPRAEDHWQARFEKGI